MKTFPVQLCKLNTSRIFYVLYLSFSYQNLLKPNLVPPQPAFSGHPPIETLQNAHQHAANSQDEAQTREVNRSQHQFQLSSQIRVSGRFKSFAQHNNEQ